MHRTETNDTDVLLHAEVDLNTHKQRKRDADRTDESALSAAAGP